MPRKSVKNNSEQTDIQYIFYNSPHPIKFRLSSGKEIIISGSPLSEIYNPSGNKFIQEKFGITKLYDYEWNEIQKLYSSMPLFKSNRIFASKTIEYGKDQAKEQKLQSNGLEQVNVNTTLSKPDKEI